MKRASKVCILSHNKLCSFLKSEVMHILLKESSEGENRPKAVERLARRAEVVLPLILFDQFMMLFVIYCVLIYFWYTHDFIWPSHDVFNLLFINIIIRWWSCTTLSNLPMDGLRIGNCPRRVRTQFGEEGGGSLQIDNKRSVLCHSHFSVSRMMDFVAWAMSHTYLKDSVLGPRG